MAQVADKTCEICARASGSFYCSDCEQLFCTDCKTSHLRSRACRNHQFMTGSDIQAKPKVLCSKHNKDYIFYCIPCDNPVCRRCMTDSHNGHQVTELHAVVTKLKSDLKNQLHSKVEYLESCLVKAKQGGELFMRGIETATRSIQQQREDLRNVVEKETECLVQSLKEMTRQEVQQISLNENQWKQLLDKGKKLQQTYEDVLGVKDEANALKILRQIRTDCNNMETCQILKFPSMVHYKSTITQSDIRRYLGTVSYQQDGFPKSNNDSALQVIDIGDVAGSSFPSFDVILQPNNDTERLRLNSRYRLHVSNVCLMLEDLHTQTPKYKWYYEHIRKYGNQGPNFAIVAGRRSDSGEGMFIFIHDDPAKIVKTIDRITKRKHKE